jgi:hypothetical protein
MSAALVILPVVWATAAPSYLKTLPEVVEQKKTAPELAFYRKYTEGMLRRYVRLSMEAGRAPSLLGRGGEADWVDGGGRETTDRAGPRGWEEEVAGECFAESL